MSNGREKPVLEPGDSAGHPMAAWFQDARRERLERRTRYLSRRSASALRSRAAITMVHNEPVMLPIWLSYYSRFFASEDIYVLDNESTDGSTDRDGFVCIPAPHDTMDDAWRARTIGDLQRTLLDRYDVVLVTDVDEIIAPVPERGALGEYLDGFDEEWVNCLGYEIVHMRDVEPPLRLEQPILDQRSYWYFNGGYDKAAVATVPMTWRPGFHGRADFQYKLDPDLRLVHLHRVDYEICLERHRTQRRRRWAEHEARRGWGAHNRITDETEFERWFYEDNCFNGEIRPESIPAAWRGLF